MTQMIMDVLVAVLVALITFGIRLIFKVVIPYFKNKLNAEQYEWLVDIVDDAVRAYEQTVTGGKNGKIKYDLVSDYVEAQARKHNIPFSGEEIHILIESAVQVMNSELLNFELNEKPINNCDNGFFIPVENI